MKGGNVKVCLSYHGHILTHTADGMQMKRHADTRDLAQIVLFDDLLPHSISIGQNSFSPEPLRTDICALQSEDGFASCRPGGRLLRATEVREFEEFGFFDQEIIYKILQAAETAWHAPDTGAGIARGAIHLAPNFRAEFQRFSLPLAGVNVRCRTDPPQIHAEDQIFTPTDRVVEADPSIWLRPLGNTANRALSYLIARRIARDVPNCTIRNYRLPEWGAEDIAPAPVSGSWCKLGKSRFWIDCDGFADALRRKQIGTLVQDAYCYNADFLPTREECRTILGPMPGTEQVGGYDSSTLLCNIRGGEVLTGRYRSYIVLPPEYYRTLAETAGLNPVFFGQLEDNAYTESLQKAFPEAEFVRGTSPEHDFETVRRSCNIAIAVSTFSWLAAWLGHADRIFVPLGGMFHPNFQKHQNYIVTGDPAFRYVLLPYAGAINLYDRSDVFFRQQALLASGMRLLSTEQAARILEKSKANWPSITRTGGFDSAYYLKANPSAQKEIEREGFGSALEHYLNIGSVRNALPFDFDAESYLLNSPEAAMALAFGDYPDALSHAQDVRARQSMTQA